jgi:hypothetical protein
VNGVLATPSYAPGEDGVTRVVLSADEGIVFVKLNTPGCDALAWIPVISGHERNVVMRLTPAVEGTPGPDADNFVFTVSAVAGLLPPLPGLHVRMCRKDDDRSCQTSAEDGGAYYITGVTYGSTYSFEIYGDGWVKDLGTMTISKSGIIRRDIMTADIVSNDTH